MNYAFLLAYDGAAFRGWQKQPGLVTVQGALEDALRKLLGKKLVVHGASRTDAGVHALAQVASMKTSSLKPDELVLPEGLRLVRWVTAPDSFHARATSCGKRYRYEMGQFVQNGDWQRARLALKGLDGLPALNGLASPSKDHRPAPPLARWTLDDCGSLFVEGPAFRKHQVRNLAGHLGAIALGYSTPESLRELAGMRRPWRGARAPAGGLTLLEVLYPEGKDPFKEPAAAPDPRLR